MATKKECDKCGTQWVPDLDFNGEDEELGIVTLFVPRLSTKVAHNEIRKQRELCQSCARQLSRYLDERPPKPSGE